MALTDTFIRQVKHAGKPTKHTDGRGLYLLVNEGGKYWRYDYRFADKRRTLALGVYPDVSLAKARERHQSARTALADGIDPNAAKRAQRAATEATALNTVEAVGMAWYELKKDGWSKTHCIREMRNLRKDLFPYLGKRSIGEVEPPELLAVIRKIEARGSLDVAKRVLITARGIWQHAIAEGFATREITQDIKKSVKTHIKRNLPAIIEPVAFGELLRASDAYRGGPVVRAALAIAPILFQRPANLRMMRWADLDLDGAVWTIPSADMKRSMAQKINGQPHIVPIPRQVVDTLRELHPLTGHLEFAFPGFRDPTKPMSEASVNAALHAMGYKDRHTWHGYRASGRTLLREKLGFDADVIEAQLAHTTQIKHGGAYDRSKFIDQRAVMLQQWADYLDKLRIGADVIPLHKSA